WERGGWRKDAGPAAPAAGPKRRARSSPAAKLQSKQHRLVDGARECSAMLQYPAGALCTELWNRVGETSRCGVARTSQIWWIISPSAPDQANTVAKLSALGRLRASASRPAAVAGLARRPASPRLAGGGRVA